MTHWVTWLGSTFGITALSFIIAEAIPFFSYLIGLIGSLCCAPTCVSEPNSSCNDSCLRIASFQLIIPAFMGLYMNRTKPRTKGSMTIMMLHVFTVALGSFLTVSGTYATIQSIIDAYKAGIVSRAFAC